ncbi:hypothetical protein AZZ61_001549, partial [Klebsiella variicola]
HLNHWQHKLLPLLVKLAMK